LEENGAISAFQYPFLRLVTGGRAAICLFFIITGYVNSLSTIKKTRLNNDPELSLIALSKSTFTRAGKLVIPTNAAICFSWLVCQLNLYRVASLIDSSWIRDKAYPPGPTFAKSIIRLLRNLTLFWHAGISEYDPTHWTIPFFLKGSMLVYLVLLATRFTKPKATKFILILLYCWAWSGGQALMEMNIYIGMLLAELHHDFPTTQQATGLLPRYLPFIIIVIGLFISSFPENDPAWAPWCSYINHIFAVHLVPAGGETSRYVVSVGASITIMGIFVSRTARTALSNPAMNFLGRISFPVYVLHCTLMRTVLTWMLYWPGMLRGSIGKPDNDTASAFEENGNEAVTLQRGGWLAFMFGLSVFYTTLIGAAYFWTLRVEPACARVVDWLTRLAFDRGDGIATLGNNRVVKEGE